MIFLFVSIAVILIGFLVVTNQQNKTQSTTSECSICHGLFPETEIYTLDELPFCSEHFKTYEDSSWIPYLTAVSTPENSNDGIKLYETKVNLWRIHKIPSVIKSRYEINGDEITTKLILQIRDIDRDTIEDLVRS